MTKNKRSVLCVKVFIDTNSEVFLGHDHIDDTFVIGFTKYTAQKKRTKRIRINRNEADTLMSLLSQYFPKKTIKEGMIEASKQNFG